MTNNKPSYTVVDKHGLSISELNNPQIYPNEILGNVAGKKILYKFDSKTLQCLTNKNWQLRLNEPLNIEQPLNIAKQIWGDYFLSLNVSISQSGINEAITLTVNYNSESFSFNVNPTIESERDLYTTIASNLYRIYYTIVLQGLDIDQLEINDFAHKATLVKYGNGQDKINGIERMLDLLNSQFVVANYRKDSKLACDIRFNYHFFVALKKQTEESLWQQIKATIKPIEQPESPMPIEQPKTAKMALKQVDMFSSSTLNYKPCKLANTSQFTMFSL